jgi:hypothetical protein
MFAHLIDFGPYRRGVLRKCPEVWPKIKEKKQTIVPNKLLASNPTTDMIYGKGGLAFHENLAGTLVNFSLVAGAMFTGVNNPIFFLADFAVMDTLQCCFSDGEYHLHKLRYVQLGIVLG